MTATPYLCMVGEVAHGRECRVHHVPQDVRVDLLPHGPFGEVVETCRPCQLYGTLGAVGVHYRQHQLKKMIARGTVLMVCCVCIVLVVYLSSLVSICIIIKCFLKLMYTLSCYHLFF